MSTPILQHFEDPEPSSRKKYRAPRKPTAVTVYTVNRESRHLLVSNVAALQLSSELIALFAQYGDIEEWQKVEDYPCEEFTEAFWIKFVSLSAARLAKRRLDDRYFFSRHLTVNYAPEYESVEDVRAKLEERRKAIAERTTRRTGQRGGQMGQESEPRETSQHPMPVSSVAWSHAHHPTFSYTPFQETWGPDDSEDPLGATTLAIREQLRSFGSSASVMRPGLPAQAPAQALTTATAPPSTHLSTGLPPSSSAPPQLRKRRRI
ncbi:uncharacterized protein VTP21DRAFT_2791 [Calcarisporiella thermophila]|uniref:uncharacterized protein n=1 Tax=Calcarisporiella thermophila TaxID=911321 RepID=UPI0037420C55